MIYFVPSGFTKKIHFGRFKSTQQKQIKLYVNQVLLCNQKSSIRIMNEHLYIAALKKSNYLMDTARDFRVKLKSASSAGAKKGQAPAAAAKPTHGTIYVAKTYPPWQCTVLSVLKEMFEAGNGGDNKAISQVRFSQNQIQEGSKNRISNV